MNPFAQLPPELICEIIWYTADFAGIESLLAISPHVKAIFQAEPRKITKHLVALNSITSMPDIHKLFQGVAFIQSNLIHCSSLDEYIHLTRENNEGLLDQLMDNAELSHYMIHIAAQIQQLACLCLSTMQKNFVSAVGTSSARSLSPAIRMQKASEPFSWIEEHRVYWVLWHLRHFSDLQNAVHTTGSAQSAGTKWCWPVESVNRLSEYAVWNDIHENLVELFWIITTVLANFGLHFLKIHPDPQKDEAQQPWDFPETTIPFLPVVELPQHIGKVNYNFPVWCPPPVPDNNPVTISWFLTPRSAGRCSVQTGMLCFRRVMLHRLSPPRTSMVAVESYRPLGFLLWDTWRMFSVGLYPNNRRERTPTPDGGFIDPEPVETRENSYHMEPRWLELIGKHL